MYSHCTEAVLFIYEIIWISELYPPPTPQQKYYKYKKKKKEKKRESKTGVGHVIEWVIEEEQQNPCLLVLLFQLTK